MSAVSDFFLFVRLTGTDQLMYYYLSSIGRTNEPKALPPGVDRQVRLRKVKVGIRVQGFPREHGWLHEPPGEIFLISCVIYHLTIFAACKHGGVPGWRIKGCSW